MCGECWETIVALAPEWYCVVHVCVFKLFLKASFELVIILKTIDDLTVSMPTSR